MTGREWIEQFARALDVDAPDDDTIEALLALAGDAAHASERTAAPIACWLVGRTGIEPAKARRVAAAIAEP
ncbi:MAG: hypothetical protein QOD72_631 [Acidimicrobiaceae bacterium]|nr:hypothetical protein [Acidimicrobiaceae bacterium]